MKKILLLCLSLFLIGNNTYAQGERSGSGQPMIQRKSDRVLNRSCPRVYLGFSTGINNPVGLIGPQIDVAITPFFSAGAGAGYSTWGYKTFLEGRYYFRNCNRGWALAAGVTYSSGLDSVKLENIETVRGKGNAVVQLKSQTNFMASAYHFFNLGRSGRNRFHLQFGLSVPMTKPEYKQTSGQRLSPTSEDAVLLLSPGGLLLGLGFSFGIGNQ